MSTDVGVKAYVIRDIYIALVIHRGIKEVRGCVFITGAQDSLCTPLALLPSHGGRTSIPWPNLPTTQLRFVTLLSSQRHSKNKCSRTCTELKRTHSLNLFTFTLWVLTYMY